MEKSHAQKLAQVLWVLITVVFVCNIAAVFLVPAAVQSSSHDVVSGAWSYLDGVLHPGEDDIVMAGVASSVLAWFWVWAEPYSRVLALFLSFCGCCTAVMLWQGRRVLDSVRRETPFCMENAVSLRRAALCCFLISAAALARTCWGLAFYHSIRPLLTYNALFCPIFLMGGLLCMVMSALFRQAARLKEENDLTI